MATVTDQIKALAPGERFCLFEFFPPKTDAGFRNLLARLNRMLALNPLFLTVTWGAGGSTSEKSLDLAATCQNDLGITTVLHLTCTNTNKEVIDNALARAKSAGIRNILALRGDPPRTKEYWTPNCDFNNAVDLVRYIKAQYGDYFCVGVAGYPEGHVDGADTTHQDPARDLPYLVEKVQAGADFIITQLFFDVDKFVAYEEMLHNTPELKDTVLIPGLMPITTYKVFTRATKLSHALIPEDIFSRLEANSSNDDTVKDIGIEVLNDIISQIDERTQGRVRGFHFYTLNLEKAVASIIESSPVLNLQNHNLAVDHDDAISLDSDSEPLPPLKSTRRRSSVNENWPAKNGLDAKRALVTKALSRDRKTLVDISKGKGVLGKDATWDEFPNGRFGDSNSPAYGEIDGYGPSLKLHSNKEVLDTWGEPKSIKDITKVFVNYLSDKIQVLPWVSSELSPETALIQEQLFEMNEKGWFTLASQPAVDGCPSSDSILGWGPSNGRLFQKSFVEFFVPKQEWDTKVKPRLQEDIDSTTITYFCGDASGHITSNLPIGKDTHNRKSAVTWGVFPSKEVLQPTVIDYESFKAWNEEAFLLWLEWARCYKKDSDAYKLLNSVYSDYYLVSMVHHNFMDEYALWNSLLD
ncbi:CIC11C00000002952 [Sungouiella intermedia]|uniref:CIC11C00000002952 n=1 Tax=Sungouiella intermedia TaxID=45354 RepID=A0A1L0GKN1_9ASCO|nr:CIC11C00000002952 [[Candida] intermedia]SGZ57675.1 CIC11C00000005943 [[Candida] intermedia]